MSWYRSPQYLDDMAAKYKAKVLAVAELDGPIEEDDPIVLFWALIRTGAELDEQYAKNANYYASGRCGGCETCGQPPFPYIPLNATAQFVARIREALDAAYPKDGDLDG